MSITLPPLPYAYDALEPYISAKTLQFHHDKHHAKYVATANDMIKGTPLQNATLAEIVKASKGTNQPLFNNAAQALNHEMYWKSLKPNGGGAPTGKVADLITRDFGSFDAFKAKFAGDANGQFGSGWAWLVQDPAGKLSVVKTGNADTPVTEGLTVLLVEDVWEHAYYLDYQNLRVNYTANFLDKLANWDYANSLLQQLPNVPQ